ncbi:hypothetical protein PRIPAC_85280, partial [Pristionchus pacificus]|uniref:Uncharacterized protein n=1 Tax=Pristionchus pacificus TaxID=54126 RepID=A0A2A6BMQ9_PRIPA
QERKRKVEKEPHPMNEMDENEERSVTFATRQQLLNAYVPAASSPQLAYKVPFHSPILTAFGHECDRLPTVPRRTPLMRERPGATAGTLLFQVLESACRALKGDGTRRFGMVVDKFNELFVSIKLSMNPFYAADSPIQSKSRPEKHPLRQE